MNRIVSGVLVLLLAWPALRAEDKSATPRQQYDTLVREYQQAQQEALKAVRAAKTPEDQQKAMKENAAKAKTNPFAVRFIALADKNAKDAVALDALAWVFAHNASGIDKAKAIDLLLRDHVGSDKLSLLFKSLRFGYDGKSETLFRAVLAKNPHKSVKAEAALALAQNLATRAQLVNQIKENAQLAVQLEGFAGKNVAEELKKADIAELETASAKAYCQFADTYSTDVPPERLKEMCLLLGFSGDKANEDFLRALLAKDKRREVQGAVSLTLAQSLKRQAELLFEKDAKIASKLRRESEELFTRAADKYADVKISFGGTVGEKAKSELFELHHLSIGMKAPEIIGEDQDGKTFKLSDYKGKVVLLDFWSRF